MAYKHPDELVGKSAQTLYYIWQTVAGDRLAPMRDEITLGLVRTLASRLWIIEVVEGGADFRFRLAGDRVIEFYGGHLSGSLLSAKASQPFFHELRRHLLHCVTTGLPFALGPAPAIFPGKEHLEIELLVLPLSDDGESVSGVTGLLEYWQLGTHIRGQ